MSTMSNVTEIKAIEKAWVMHVERESKRPAREPHPYIYASRRQKCLRRMVLEAARPECFPEFDADVKAKMTAGKRREIDLTTDLQRLGELCIPRFEFVGQQQRVRVYDRKGRLVISGMIDGAIRWESGAEWPVEIKHLSSFTTDRISEFGDLFHGKWTWSAAHQILSYLYAKDAPNGLFILGRMGLPRLLHVRLEDWLEEMEGFIRDCTLCVDHIEAGTLPDYTDDPEECRTCPVFGSHCQPPVKYDASGIVTDAERILRFEKEIELKPTAAEYKDLHEDNVAYLRGLTEKGKAKTFIVGSVVATVKWQKQTSLNIPTDLKQQYAVSDPSGKISVSLTKVDGV